MSKQYFKDLDVSNISGKTVIVDIDGTLVADNTLNFDRLIFSKIQELAITNSVFLFSNKNFPARNDALSGELKIPLLRSKYKKPSKKVINSLPDNLKKDIAVIGDKKFVDGLFAKNIKAEFIRVCRITSPTDNAIAKIAYILDDFLGLFLSQNDHF